MENNSNQQIINLSYLIGLSKGDKNFVRKMINVFLDENPAEVADLERHINSADFVAIRAAAHKLKSTIPFVGLDSVIGKEVIEIETLAASNSGIDDINKMFLKIKQYSGLAYKELEKFLESK